MADGCKIVATKEFVKNEIFENRPDWEQSDETAPDYIKHRLMYDNPLESINTIGTEGVINQDLLPANIPILVQELSTANNYGSYITPAVLCDSFAANDTYWPQINCIFHYQAYTSIGFRSVTTLLNDASKYTNIDKSNFEYVQGIIYKVVIIIDETLLDETNLALYPKKGVYLVPLQNLSYNYVVCGIYQSVQLPDRFIDKNIARKTWVTNELNGKISSPATATVGQVITVKAVDANGKPTEWECVDRVSKLSQLENDLSGVYLTDKNTGTKYLLEIVDGKLTVSEGTA